jgi:hypothetical protein
MAAASDGTPPKASPLDPDSVLSTAFAGHDFVVERDEHEVHIQTSEPSFDGDTAYIAVNAIIWDADDDDAVVTYRYRIELVDRR